MKATLEFNLPEDYHEWYMAVHGNKMYSALYEIQQEVRRVRKYGTNLDRTDIDLIGWLNHLQEELMDATLYIEKLKKIAK